MSLLRLTCVASRGVLLIEGRKILVAGGTGLVGANLVPRLLALKARVTATCHSRRPKFFSEVYVPADFTDAATAVRLTEGIEDLIVCAAYTSGIEETRKKPTAAILPNLLIQANLLEAARVNGVERVILFSSSTLYQPADHPIREDELDLNRPPFDAYQAVGNLYRYLEQLAKFYHQRFGLDIGLLRPSSIYGPFDHFEPGKSHVLPALIRRALARETPFRVWGSPDVVRDFVFVDDVVDAALDVLEHYCTCDPLNIGLGQPTTIGELVEAVLEVCGHRAPVEYDQSQPTAIPYRVLNTVNYDTLFLRKRTSLKDGLGKTIAWYKSQLET